MKRVAAILLAGIGALLQAQGPTNASVAAAEAIGDAREQQELSQAVSQAGNSQVDYIRALERHLAKFPNTKQRAAIEKALAKTALDTNDTPRIVLYGERVLGRESPDDMQLIDRVTRALVDKGDPERAKRVLPLIKRYEADIQASRSQQPPGHLSAGLWSDLIDSNMARAMALEARATGEAGSPADAVKLAEQSWALCPTGEGARAAGYWLSKMGRDREALEYYADAFTFEDTRTTKTDRAGDRARLGELYRKVNKSEKGLGELILQAYDRTSALAAARGANLRARDPNAETVDLLDFILPAVDGSAPLRVSSLRGKTVVMDFWATWCVPCREQHPLIENVKKHFASEPGIVFLSVDADDDPSLAAPFVKKQGWETGYFEAGLARRFNVSSIPTILIVDQAGEVSSHMAGFDPASFEGLLTERIDEARQSK
jgi:cytochrome c biogenesis protein CcmG/thiol:disulfide interchange protein DsbE